MEKNVLLNKMNHCKRIGIGWAYSHLNACLIIDQIQDIVKLMENAHFGKLIVKP